MESTLQKWAYKIAVHGTADATISVHYWSAFSPPHVRQFCTKQCCICFLEPTERCSMIGFSSLLTVVWEDPGLNHTMDGCVYHDSCCDIQPWAQAVHLYCTAQVDSAFHPSRDGKMSICITTRQWQWWMWTVAANFWQTHSPSRLAWSEGWQPPSGRRSVYIHQMNWVNSCSYPGHDDNTR